MTNEAAAETKVEKLTNINEILSSIQKNLKAPKDKKNNFGNFFYRDAESILESYKAEIAKESYPALTLLHKFKLNLLGSRIFAECVSTLELADGSKKEADGFAEIEASKKGMDGAQLSGAVMSYAKKYALCNLFAIDDSKDDPDANGKKKKEDKPADDRKRLASAIGDDMQETQAKAAQAFFAKMKKDIEDCGSQEEMEGLVEKQKVKINKLQKYHNDLYQRLMETIEAMKGGFAEEENV